MCEEFDWEVLEIVMPGQRVGLFLSLFFCGALCPETFLAGLLYLETSFAGVLSHMLMRLDKCERQRVARRCSSSRGNGG